MKKLISVFISIAIFCSIIPNLAFISSANKTDFSDSGDDNSSLLPMWTRPQTTGSYNDTPEWLSSVIMTEVRLDKVTEQGTLSAAYQMLDYYEQTGVNCLWITPINEMGTHDVTSPNGYHNNGLHTIDLNLTEATSYAEGWANFGKFVTAAHNHNIRILLDVVMWGVDGASPMITDPAYSGIVSSNVSANWIGNEYNYNSAIYQNYYQSTMLNIINTTGIDGIRVDLAPEVEGCTTLLNSIRQSAFNQGTPIVIMSENAANDRANTYDLDQIGVLDRTSKKYWDSTWLTDMGFGESSDNWVVNIYDTADFWLDNNIVTTTKSGSIMSGSKLQQQLGLTGRNKYYTYCLSCHDFSRDASNDVLRFGYQAIFSPAIPLWYMGEEFADLTADGGSGNLYYTGALNLGLINDQLHGAFYNKIKKYIKIRRTYTDIFESFSDDHRNSNICAVDVSGIKTYQAYARYANGKAVLIIPNGTDKAADITVSVPVNNAGISSGFTVKNLLTDKVITCSENKFIINVEPGDMAVVLVDDGMDTATGCEATLTSHESAKEAFASTSAGKASSLIDNIGAVDINSKLLIANARASYNALNDAEKMNVKNSYILFQAEKKYANIVAHNNSDYSYYLSSNSLYPNNSTKNGWYWDNSIVALENLNNGGVNLKYNTAVGLAYRFEIAKPIVLDGAHINLKVVDQSDTLSDSELYYSKILNIKLSSAHALSDTTGSLNLKLDIMGGQLAVTVNGVEADHSGMQGYNSRYTDRTFTSLVSDLDIRFSVITDGSIEITINGKMFTVKAADVIKATGLTDMNAVYVSVAPQGGKLSCNLNYIHGGDENCLCEVTPLENLCSTYGAKASLFSPNLVTYGWDTVINRTDTESGLRVTHSGVGKEKAYCNWTTESYPLDGTHFGIILNGKDYNARVIRIKLSDIGDNSDSGLNIKLDSDGSQLAAYINGTSDYQAIDHSIYDECYPGRTDRLYLPNVINTNTDSYDIRFVVRSDGGISIFVNTYEFIISSSVIEQIESLSDLNNVHIGLSAIGGELDYTMNYFHGGNQACAIRISNTDSLIAGINSVGDVLIARKSYDSLNAAEKLLVKNYPTLLEAEKSYVVCDRTLYKVKLSDVLPDVNEWSWPVACTDTEEGLNISYNNNLNWNYRFWFKKPNVLNGAHLRITLNNMDDYYKRMFVVTLSDNAGNGSAGLYLKFDNGGGQLSVHCDTVGNCVDTTGMSGYDGTYNDRVFNSAYSQQVMDILFLVGSDGSLKIRTNGFEFTVSSAIMSTLNNLTNLDSTYLGISSAGSDPDLTVNWLHSGDEMCYECESGDVNGDHYINVKDLVRMKRYLAGCTKIYEYAANLDKNDSIDVLDLTALRKLLLVK